MKNSSVAAPKRSARTANCTHINMNRVYDQEQQCYNCGRFPTIGFLYECRQEEAFPDSSYKTKNASEGTARKSALRLELEAIGLSESIIITAEQGGYTAHQLEKLKSLKVELEQTVQDTLQRSQANSVFAKLAALANGPSNNDGTSSSKAEEVSPLRCRFKACHMCRPYFKDRIYLSFPAVFADHVPHLTFEETKNLPTKDARILKYIGLVPNPSSPGDFSSPGLTTLTTDFSTASDLRSCGASVLTFKTTQSDIDEISHIRRPRRRFYNIGTRDSGDIARDLAGLGGSFRHCLKLAFQGVFRTSRESSSSGSNVTLPLARTGTLRDVTQGTRDFDIDSLRRVQRQKEQADLRGGVTVQNFEGLLRRGSTTSGDNDNTSAFTVHSCASEGSEVKVDGGVALTEEAVETHVPDILRFSVDRAVKEDILEVGEGQDIGLTSIMTQA